MPPTNVLPSTFRQNQEQHAGTHDKSWWVSNESSDQA